MVSIHKQFGNRVDQCIDEETLIDYLLQAAPTYGRICMGDVSVTDEAIEEYLDVPMTDDNDGHGKQRMELTPFGCPCSKRADVCIDTESASLVCMECGHIARAGFVHSVNDLSCVNTWPKYIYQPKAYLAQHLKHLEGQGYPRFTPELLTSIREDLLARNITLSNTKPNDVYATLKRLKLGRLYPHRWALTKRMNATYRPLILSHELYERLEKVFIGCYTRYASQRAKPVVSVSFGRIHCIYFTP